MTAAKTSTAAGRKPKGYWQNPANVIAEAKAVVEKHGPEALSARWLKANGHSSLSTAICKSGGLAWIMAELGLEQSQKPPGYWNDSANVIAEARVIVKEHGSEALTAGWLKANGYGGLGTAICKSGGFYWLRAELGLGQGQKPPGYWNDSANVLAEARAIVEEHGPEALIQGWLVANGHSSLAVVLRRHGGFTWLRTELGLEQGKKPRGYWNDPANVIAEAQAIVEEHGPEALIQGWLVANGHGGLNTAIPRHGGITWLRTELGLEQGRKPKGYWEDPANVIAVAKAIVEEHGPEALSAEWLADNGHSSMIRGVVLLGGVSRVRAELDLEQGNNPPGYWNDSANVISGAKTVVEEYGPEALTQSWLATRGYGGLNRGIALHGGFRWIRAELDLELGQKPLGYWNDPANVIAEARAIVEEYGSEALNAEWLRANGYSSLGSAVGKHGGFFWIWAELDVEAPAKPSNPRDSMRHALDCTGLHIRVRECSLYLYELANYPGYSKPGIAFDIAERVRQSGGQYGEEHLSLVFPTRQEAFFLEQAVLNATRGSADCPEQLWESGWDGRTEVRAMPAEDLVPTVLRLAEELEELGVWEFASLRVPMSCAQRAICQQRALAGAPACATAQ